MIFFKITVLVVTPTTADVTHIIFRVYPVRRDDKPNSGTILKAISVSGTQRCSVLNPLASQLNFTDVMPSIRFSVGQQIAGLDTITVHDILKTI